MPTQAATRSGDVVARGSFTAAAAALANQEPVPSRCLRQLMTRRLYADAVQFLAQWLTSRDRTWWGCLCLWHVARPGVPDSLQPVFQATVRWVQSGAEQRRQELAALVETAEPISDPVVGLARAAACASPARAPNVLLSALLVAAARRSPLDPAVAQRDFVELGLEIAEGKNCWA